MTRTIGTAIFAAALSLTSAAGHESLKRYCPGIGLVQDNDAMLEEFDLHRDNDDDD